MKKCPSDFGNLSVRHSFIIYTNNTLSVCLSICLSSFFITTIVVVIIVIIILRLLLLISVCLSAYLPICLSALHEPFLKTARSWALPVGWSCPFFLLCLEIQSQTSGSYNNLVVAVCKGQGNKERKWHSYI